VDLAAGGPQPIFDGGDNIDTVEVNGSDDSETFTATANGTFARFDRVSPAPYALDMVAENLVLNANGGADSFAATGNLAALIKITVNGGPGNDTLLGSNGADILIGGEHDDFIDGQQGNDTLIGGLGDDRFQWDPGDGNDVIEGQAGMDSLLFNGSNIGEIVELAANGARARFTRNVANIILDMDGVEKVTFNARGGADTITVNDMTGTAVTTVALDLASVPGSSTGDAQIDAVIVNGTGGNDTVMIAGGAGSATVTGLAATVNIASGAEGALDTLRVNGLGGNDTLDASGLAAGTLNLTLDGGDGTDTLIGTAGTDVGLNGEVLVNIP
jgi:Ca2+-binding RTX toxin-like protein